MRVLFLKLFYPLLALSAFVHPLYGVWGYAFISVIRPECFTWGFTQISNVFLISLLCLLLSSIFNKKIQITIIFTPFFLSFISFVLMLYLATYASPYTYFSLKQREFTFQFLQALLTIFIYCLCLFSILLKDVKALDKFIVFVTGCFLFMALWGLEQRSNGNILIEGLFGQAIRDRCAITGIFVLFLPWGLFCLNTAKKGEVGKKFIGILSTIAFPLIIFFTDSRAGFLGFMLTVFIIGIAAKNKIRNLILILVAVGLIITVIPWEYKERIGSIFNSGTEEVEDRDYSSGSRLVLWKMGFVIFAENPLLGVGNLNFSEAAYQRRNYFDGKIEQGLYDYTFQENFKLQCHNMFVNVFAEGGLLTAIPFYLLMFLPFRRAWKLRSVKCDQNPVLLKLKSMIFYNQAGLLGYLVTCTFANMRFIDFYYWALTILYLSCVMFERELKKGVGLPVLGR